MKQSLKLYLFIIMTATLSSIPAGAQNLPLVDESSFNTAVDGKHIGLYTITNGTITAQITNYHGYIVGLFTPDRNGAYSNIVGHNETFEAYKSYNGTPCGPALGRYANRIGGASFTLDGVKYSLTANEKGNILHGGRYGFDNVIWDVESVEKDRLVLSCTLEDGLDGFPGNLKTFLTFSITGDNALSIDFKATTDKPTVCNLSHHVYFNLNGSDAADVLDHILSINADSVTQVSDALIPTGKILPVEGTPFDFRQPVRIGDRQSGNSDALGAALEHSFPDGQVRIYDQNFCLNHSDLDKVEAVATLYSPASGRLLEMFNNHPGLQIYTGGLPTIALESQRYPDSPNHPDFPSAVLRPGETYSHTILYKFSVK